MKVTINNKEVKNPIARATILAAVLPLAAVIMLFVFGFILPFVFLVIVPIALIVAVVGTDSPDAG